MGFKDRLGNLDRRAGKGQSPDLLLLVVILLHILDEQFKVRLGDGTVAVGVREGMDVLCQSHFSLVNG